ncbi:MAG TPA: PA domain-containing protein, partial [Acidobacteriota bacterium]|nr:PA domain-containing protein [Acidobacteriota bacterium]
MSPRALPALVVALPAALARALVVALFAALPLAHALAFEEGRAKATVETIAADEFGGRFSGLASGRMVEDYVAARFKEWDLLPAGDDGSYFHEFPMLATRERSASLSLLDGEFGRVDFLYGDDFTLVTNSGSGNVTAEAVLVGRGLASPEREWDDYAAAGDVKGKIVVVVRGTPENGYNWSRMASRDSILHEAVRRGAAGVLFYGGTRAVQGAAVHDGSYFPEVPSAFAGERVMQQ